MVVNVEIVLTEGENEWDYMLRRHHVPAGGEEYFVNLFKKAFSEKLERGKAGNFGAVVKVNGNAVATLEKLTKEDLRKLEDNMVEVYKGMRKLSGGTNKKGSKK